MLLSKGDGNMTTFEEIVAMTKQHNKEDLAKLEQIRHQRQLAGEILAGRMFHGFELSEAEERFVLLCNRAMRPIKSYQLSALEKINKRRWSR